jgi:hypothetical protein
MLRAAVEVALVLLPPMRPLLLQLLLLLLLALCHLARLVALNSRCLSSKTRMLLQRRKLRKKRSSFQKRTPPFALPPPHCGGSKSSWSWSNVQRTLPRSESKPRRRRLWRPLKPT